MQAPTTDCAPLEPLLSVQEARAILGIAEVTLHRWIAQRRIGSVKIGDRRMFERAELERFIADGREDAAA